MTRSSVKGALGTMALVTGLVAGIGACYAPPEKPTPTAEEDAPAVDEPEAQPADDTSPARVAEAPANGWGDAIAWRSLDAGRAEAKRDNRPIMLIVWTGWCPKCRALKESFAANEHIRELSENFVMVNVNQDEMEEVSSFGPDGDYIPRVMFLDADGEIDDEVLNGNRRRAKYFYTQYDDIPAKMREALERHAARS